MSKGVAVSKHDADLRAGLVEGGDAVRVGLVAAAMPVVLLAVAQQDLVQLLDVVLGERDVLPGREHQVHHLGVAGHFLFVAGGEGLDLQVGQQPLHLPVGQLAALDAGGGADALDGRHAAQRRQPVRRERAQGAPRAFELVDPGNEAQDLRRDLDGVGFQHEPILHPFTPNFEPYPLDAHLHPMWRGFQNRANAWRSSENAGETVPPRRQRTQKRPEPLRMLGFPALSGLARTAKWWRWRESNPRPKALHPRPYMLSSPFGLALRQHGVRSTPQDQPVLI